MLVYLVKATGKSDSWSDHASVLLYVWPVPVPHQPPSYKVCVFS